MKNLLFIFLFIQSISVFSQPNFRKGPRLGLKLNFTGAAATGGRTKTYVRPSVGCGIWIQLKMGKKWTAQSEVLYVEKGAGGEWYSYSRYGTYWFNLEYAEFPVYFNIIKSNSQLNLGQV